MTTISPESRATTETYSQSYGYNAVTRMPMSRSYLQQPELINYGGRVLKSPRIVNLYYGAYWTSGIGAQDRRYQDAFSKYLVKSRYTNVWKEYGSGKGSFGDSLIVVPKEIKPVISERSVQEIVKNARRQGAIGPQGPETVYTLYLPPSVVLEAPDGTSSLNGLGGYHGSYRESKGLSVYYAAVVFAQAKNGINFTGNSRDNISIIASHEWSEVATDPDVNRGQLGWYDRRYGEIGDIPLNIGMPFESVYDRLGRYAVQKEWSNEDGVAEVSKE